MSPYRSIVGIRQNDRRYVAGKRAHFGFQKSKNRDGVCKSARRYVAGTKYGHLTGPLWACFRMTVDTLLKLSPFLVQKGEKIGMVCAKVSVDTLLGPNMVTLPVHYWHASE